LILAIVVAYQPATREQMKDTWEHVRPTAVAVMDGLYSVVRTLISGDGRDDQIDNDPVSPAGDFDRIVTLKPALPL
jgi:hypothetical protein